MTTAITTVLSLCSARHDRGAGLAITDKVLSDIGTAFSNRDQCIVLAVRLKIGENEVFKLFGTPFSDRLAYTIIKKWIEVHDERATGPALYAALQDIIGHDLANQFKEGLFARGELLDANRKHCDKKAINLKGCLSTCNHNDRDEMRNIFMERKASPV